MVCFILTGPVQMQQRLPANHHLPTGSQPQELHASSLVTQVSEKRPPFHLLRPEFAGVSVKQAVMLPALRLTMRDLIIKVQFMNSRL